MLATYRVTGTIYTDTPTTLHREAIHHRKPAVKIVMTDANKVARVQFAREFRGFDFPKAIFANEKV